MHQEKKVCEVNKNVQTLKNIQVKHLNAKEKYNIAEIMMNKRRFIKSSDIISFNEKKIISIKAYKI